MTQTTAFHGGIRLICLMLAIFLSGCAGQRSATDPGALADGAVSTPVKPVDRVDKDAEPVASFKPDTLYDLMVAEIGGQRKRYDLALGNYLKQAHKTRDAGVARRAYQIAMFVGARQAALDAALLWSDLEPDNTEALQASALELIHSGELDRALRKMQGILVLGGEAGFDFLAASAAGMSVENRQLFLAEFEKLQEKYPENRDIHLGRAILYKQSDQNNKALELASQLLRKDPDFVKAMIIKGRILNALGRADEAEAMLSEAVKRHPERLRLRLLYARLLVHSSKLDEARKQFEVLLKQSPDDREILLSLALVTMENGMDKEAEKYFQRLQSLGFMKNKTNFYLGKLKERQGDYEAAQQHYLDVGSGKDFMAAQVALAQLRITRGKFDEAIEGIVEARKRNPAQAESLFLLEGELLAKNGQLKEAMVRFDEGIQFLPKSINLLYSRAMVHERLDNIDGLESDLNRILKLQPDNAAALNALGYTLADRSRRLKEAEMLIKRAYELDSNDPAILDSMGWVQYRLGNYEKAVKYLRMAYEKYPDQEIAAHLGEVLWVMGQREEAKSVWGTALEKTPDSEVLKETMERLKSEYDEHSATEAVSQAELQ